VFWAVVEFEIDEIFANQLKMARPVNKKKTFKIQNKQQRTCVIIQMLSRI